MRFLLYLAILIASSKLQAQNTYQLLDTEEQDPAIFTQGLVIYEDDLFISSGLYGKSFLKKIEGDSEVTKHLDRRYFAEGITVLDDRVYMLTWRAGKLMIFDKQSLELLDSKPYDGEGWGLTHDDQVFYMSNGSHFIQLRSHGNFELKKYLRITKANKPIKRLNELEFAKDALWANAWYSNSIYKIDPSSGDVIASWDLTSLVNSLKLRNHQAVLNGIAYDEDQDAFWITGKLWPKRFLVRFEQEKAPN